MDDCVKENGVTLTVKRVVKETVSLLAGMSVRVVGQTLAIVMVLELFYEIGSCARECAHVGDETGHLHFCLQSAAVFWNS